MAAVLGGRRSGRASLVTRVLRRLLAERVAGIADADELRDVGEWLVRQAVAVDARVRAEETPRAGLPRIESHDGREVLRTAVVEATPPWHETPLPLCDVPGMLPEEDRRYYAWLGRFYAGLGEVVELGCWLGCSTHHIVHGLLPNPHFAGRRLHVMDHFVWRTYMGDWYPGDADLADGTSFRPLFDRYTQSIAAHLHVAPCRIVPTPNDEDLPPLAWSGGPIEICWIDCGRTVEINEAWFRVLAPHFLPGRTLLVLQDWGTHREVPVRWYNQTKMFTDARAASLRLVHELARGGVATFLFTGG